MKGNAVIPDHGDHLIFMEEISSCVAIRQISKTLDVGIGMIKPATAASVNIKGLIASFQTFLQGNHHIGIVLLRY